MAQPIAPQGISGAIAIGGQPKVGRVLRGFQTKAAGLGYLHVCEGDTVEVLYEGVPGTSEDGWIYARLSSSGSREAISVVRSEAGWMPQPFVDLSGQALSVVRQQACWPPRSRADLSGQVLGALGGIPMSTQCTVASASSGPASLASGGSESGVGEPPDAVSALVTRRFHSTLLGEGRLRAVPAADSPEFEEPRLSPNDSVRVVALQGGFAKVEVDGGTKGWIPVALLAERPSTEACSLVSTQEPESEPSSPPLSAAPWSHPSASSPKQERRASTVTSARGLVAEDDAGASTHRLAAEDVAHAGLAAAVGTVAQVLGARAPVAKEPACSWLEMGLRKKVGEAAAVPQPHVDPVRGLAPCLGRVDLVTFGLENFDQELAERCWDHPGGGSYIVLDEGELRAALVRRSVPADTVIIDARCFPDPEALLFTRHTGQHFEIISRIYQHRNFRRWLAGVKRRFLKARAAAAGDPDASRRPLTLAVYCRSGKHRSVAVAAILAYVLRSQGWVCPPTRHLSQPRWGHFCCRGLCDECQNPPPQLEETLSAALHLWHCLGSAS